MSTLSAISAVIDEIVANLFDAAERMENGEDPTLTGPMALRKFASLLEIARAEYEEELIDAH